MNNACSLPILSIIVPVYNVEKYLRHGLDSILQQTMTNFEIICVNDGSTDESLKILKEYESMDVRLHVISQTNGGLGNARNTGISHARGKWITFVDPDDFLEPDMYEKFMDEASYRNHSAQVIVCRYDRVKADGTPFNDPVTEHFMRIFPKKSGNVKMGDLSLTSINPSVWNKWYLKDIIDQNNLRFRSPRLPVEDSCFNWQYYTYTQNISIIQDVLYHYVDQETSLTNVQHANKVNFLDFINVIDEIIVVWIKEQRFELFTNLDVLLGFYLTSAQHYIAENQQKFIFQYIDEIIRALTRVADQRSREGYVKDALILQKAIRTYRQQSRKMALRSLKRMNFRFRLKKPRSIILFGKKLFHEVSHLS
ncbi:MAG: glycosyltransferase family 2 protein [Akkermansia sp.]